jgi:hypothetical protein
MMASCPPPPGLVLTHRATCRAALFHAHCRLDDVDTWTHVAMWWLRSALQVENSLRYG